MKEFIGWMQADLTLNSFSGVASKMAGEKEIVVCASIMSLSLLKEAIDGFSSITNTKIIFRPIATATDEWYMESEKYIHINGGA